MPISEKKISDCVSGFFTEMKKLNIACLTFTCRRDAEMAARHSALVPPHWKKFWCVTPEDANIPHPRNVTILPRAFDRGGSLRWEPAITGMRNTWLELLALDFDVFVKMDSDCALFRPDAFEMPMTCSDTDFTYIRRMEKEGRLFCNGCCYAFSRRACELLRDETFYPRGIPKQLRGHEDLIFSAFWTAYRRELNFCQIRKDKVFWKVKPYFEPDIIAAHYGYVKKQAADLFKRHVEAHKKWLAESN